MRENQARKESFSDTLPLYWSNKIIVPPPSLTYLVQPLPYALLVKLVPAGKLVDHVVLLADLKANGTLELVT
jgi:hypothetical protein